MGQRADVESGWLCFPPGSACPFRKSMLLCVNSLTHWEASLLLLYSAPAMTQWSGKEHSPFHLTPLEFRSRNRSRPCVLGEDGDSGRAGSERLREASLGFHFPGLPQDRAVISGLSGPSLARPGQPTLQSGPSACVCTHPFSAWGHASDSPTILKASQWDLHLAARSQASLFAGGLGRGQL